MDSRRSFLGGAVVLTAAAALPFGRVPTYGARFALAKGNEADPGNNLLAIGLFSIADMLSIPVGTDLVQTSGYAARGVGIARYVCDAAVDAEYVTANPPGAAFVSTNGRGFRLAELIPTPQMFGATATGDETLYVTSYTSDANGAVTITQQTTDGLALNAMFRWLRSLGGGACRIPKGTYSVYGGLERIDFPCLIEGAGRGITTIRNCSTSPTNTNGYGILVIQPATLADVTIRDITLDGRVLNRRRPTNEFRNYPLAVYGAVRLVLERVNSVNSPIDCLVTGYNNDMTVSLKASNCLFSNAYRNTISNVAGWNQQFTNCTIEKGGIPFGGTNPRYCIDIEPDAPLLVNTIKNITYTGCTIREALNVLAGGIWAGNVCFYGCRFQAYGGPTGGGASGSQPYLGYFRGGEFTFSDCTFEYKGSGYDGQFVCAPPEGSGDYATTEFVRLDGCRFSGAGISGYGLHMIFNNVEVKNSLRPVLIGGNGTQNLKIQGMTLTNVFDPTNRNAGGGSNASFAITNQAEGRINIDAVDIAVNPAEMPRAFLILLAATTQAYGFSNNAASAATAEAKITNVRVSGFYRKLPMAIGKALNENNFRDWGSGNPLSVLRRPTDHSV